MFLLVKICGLVFTICELKAVLYTADEPRCPRTTGDFKPLEEILKLYEIVQIARFEQDIYGLLCNLSSVKRAAMYEQDPHIFDVVIKTFNGYPRTKALLGLLTLPNQTYIDAFAIGYAAAMPDDYDRDDEYTLYSEIFSTRSGDEIKDIMEAWDNVAQVGGKSLKQHISNRTRRFPAFHKILMLALSSKTWKDSSTDVTNKTLIEGYAKKFLEWSKMEHPEWAQDSIIEHLIKISNFQLSEVLTLFRTWNNGESFHRTMERLDRHIYRNFAGNLLSGIIHQCESGKAFYYAHVLSHALPSRFLIGGCSAAHYLTMCHILVSRAEIDIDKIQEIFKDIREIVLWNECMVKLEDFTRDPHAKCLMGLLNGITIGRKEVYPAPCKP